MGAKARSTRRVAVLLPLPALTLAVLVGQAPSVYFETSATSTLGVELSALVSAELPPGAIVETIDRAQLVVSLEREGAEALKLIARSRGGTIVLERVLSLSGGMKPALRVAVLLVREAIDDVLVSRPPPPVRARPPAIAVGTATATVTPDEAAAADAAAAAAAEEVAFGLSIAPLIAVIGWQTPSFPPQLGAGASLEARFDVWEATATAIFAGHACCDRTSSDVTGDAREVLIAAGIGARLHESGDWIFGARAALGIDLISGESQGTIFMGPGTRSSFEGTTLIALASVWAGVALPLSLELRTHVGVRFAASPPVIASPEAFMRPPGTTPDPLDAGYATLFASLGVLIPLL